MFEAVLNSLPQQIVVLDEQGTALWVNEAWREFGRTNGAPPDVDHIGTSYIAVCEGFPGSDGSTSAADGLSAVLAGERPTYELQYPCHSPSEERWFELQARRVQFDNATYCLVAHHDVTELYTALQRSDAQATTDELTGLANRRRFNDFLEDAIAIADRSGSSLSLMVCDVDSFKGLNDQFGHQFGDRCLEVVAHAIGSIAQRKSDLAARLGGDEFALVLPHTTRAICESQRLAVQEYLARASPMLAMEVGHTIQLTVSFGIASREPGSSLSAEALMHEADAAMYRAKQQR